MAAETRGAKAPKGYKGVAMEGVIAAWYARNTRSRIDEQRALARRISGLVPRGGSVLEVAPGPGYLSVELARLGTCTCSGLKSAYSAADIEELASRTSFKGCEIRRDTIGMEITLRK
jgi:hypothetical protein